MKFEMVEPPDWDDSSIGDVESEIPQADSDDRDEDSIQGLRAETVRLVSGVQAVARRIDQCVAEMADLAALAAQEQIRHHAPAAAARPPAEFHPARFGPRESQAAETVFTRPPADATDSAD